MPPQSSIKYNVRWGNITKSTSFTTAAEMCAKYKRKMRSLLKRNKELARALGAAKAEIGEHKAAACRHAKVEALCLPQLKLWLEANTDNIRGLFENHVRSIRLLEHILTPGADITLAVETNLVDEARAAGEHRRLSLHPPGSRYCNQDRSMSTVLEEEGEDRTKVLEPSHDFANPEVGRSSNVTVRKNSRHSGRHCSLPDEPYASVDQPLGVPAFAVVDEEASSLVAEITGQEKSVVCAETVVMLPPDKLKGHSVHEYSAAFSHRPKIPRTPCSADRDARLVPSPEGACSSPVQTRAQHRRVSETPLPPWPRKPASTIRTRRSSSTADSMAQGNLNRRLSGPVEEFGAEATNASLLSPTCIFDVAFVESPSPTQLLKRNTLSPQRVADSRGDENSPPEAKTRRRQLAIKSSRPSDGTKPKAASRVTFVVKKGRSQIPEDVAVGPINDADPPLAPSVNQQQEQGCGDRPQDVEGSTKHRRQAALDVADPSSPRNIALQPKQECCVDEKLPRGTKSRGKKSRSRKSQAKKTADSEEPPPQPAAPSSSPPPPPCAQKNGRLPLPEPLDAGATSSTNDEGGPPCWSSRRQPRNASKCTAYRELNLNAKMRRP